jgi:hypothetical protein
VYLDHVVITSNSEVEHELIINGSLNDEQAGVTDVVIISHLTRETLDSESPKPIQPTEVSQWADLSLRQSIVTTHMASLA